MNTPRLIKSLKNYQTHKIMTDKNIGASSYRAEFINDIRLALVNATACEAQEGADGSFWPCGTCTCAFLATIIREDKDYYDHNAPPDRINEVWRAILQIRDYQENSKK
jgi:hypothetical protein